VVFHPAPYTWFTFIPGMDLGMGLQMGPCVVSKKQS
jgi:hypothetical protein